MIPKTSLPPASTGVAASRRCRSVLMVGTSPDVRGGISTVVRGYEEGGLFQRFDVRYVVTHVDGGVFAKASTAARAYVRAFVALCTMDAPLVHIHLASRASFWRKSVLCGLAMLFRRPYVLQVHGGEFSKFYEQECGAFAKWLVRTLLERAGLVIALADLWRVALARIAPQARIRVLYNAVALPASVPRIAASEPHRILFSGRLGKRKGTLDLVRAFARIAPRFPGAELIFAGEGDVEEAKRLAAELGVADRVSCLGWLGREAMRVQLARATVYALPSYAEGVPMALLEAMSWGVPVLTTPVGGIPEVVQSDYNGLVITPGDVDAIERALTKLLISSATRVRLGHAARTTIAEKFSLDGAIAALGALYREFGVPDRGAMRAQASASPRVAND